MPYNYTAPVQYLLIFTQCWAISTIVREVEFTTWKMIWCCLLQILNDCTLESDAIFELQGRGYLVANTSPLDAAASPTSSLQLDFLLRIIT